MHLSGQRALLRACTFGSILALFATRPATAQLQLGVEQFVQAGEADILVPGYSVPSLVFWNDDALPDLMVGEGSGTYPGKVRVYLNKSTTGTPQFAAWGSADSFYVQSNSADLSVPGISCMGAFPRIWNANGRKDLLVGQADGKVKLFKNVGTDAAPRYDGGTFLQAGPAGQKTDQLAGLRSACSQVDWNNDTKQDLLVGDGGGTIRVFLNQGTNATPDFASYFTVQSGSGTLTVGSRASPAFADLNRDGLSDLLVGDANGGLHFYKNTGSLSSPAFGAETVVLNSSGTTFDLAQYRSRPFVCDWNGDHQLDVLVGSSDGKIRLYAITPEPGTMCLVGVGAFALLRRRCW